MSSWCIHERTQLGGGEGRKWTLAPDQELLVGSSPDCGMVIRTQGVDSSHALFRWDQKNLSYIVKDLNTSNGTFVNNHPLIGTSRLLKHNDAIRFGLDKDHVFRMEECFCSSASVKPKHSDAMATGTGAMSSAMSPQTDTTVSPPPPSSPVHSQQESRIKLQHAIPISPVDGDVLSPQRSDGRRTVDVEHSPALNKGSKLYGQPNWWGQDVSGKDGAEARNKELEFVKPGSQILRDLEPEQPKLLHKADELRMQAISSSRVDPITSWVVEFGNGTATGTLPGARRLMERGSRPRSADPSPNRLSARRDPSPLPKRALTPVQYKRHSSLSTPSPQPAVPITKKQRAATPPVSRPKGPSAKKPLYETPKKKPLGKPPATPPQATTPRSKNHQAVPRPLQPKSQVRSSESLLKTDHPAQQNSAQASTPIPINDASIDLKSLNEGPLSHLAKSEDEPNTYTACLASSGESNSTSSLSEQLSLTEQRPVVVTGTEERECESGEKPGEDKEKALSATRKQWTEGEVQNLDSLMMASIEGRMRKLSKLAHQTARQVTALKNSIQDGHQMEVKGMDYLSLRDMSQVVTRPEQKLPEWKSYNHEANSIFRNMRVVEKWLQDIDGTLNSIQPVRQTPTSGEEYTDLASDGEVYLDTRDIFESASDGD